MSTLKYLLNVLKDKNIASITPSSRYCVEKVCNKIDFSRDLNVIEYGPGCGVFSRYILSKMTLRSKLIGLETNSNFVKHLQKEFRSDSRFQIFCTSAENVRKVSTSLGIKSVDYILSGIPFSFIDTSTKLNILSETYDLLRINGKFLTYQTFLLPNKRDKHLKVYIERFFDVINAELEYFNLPPMRVYESIKTRESVCAYLGEMGQFASGS